MESSVQTSLENNSDYENFYGTCPYCEQVSIFNRRDDLHTFEPISYREVICLNKECQKKFSISSDSVNLPAELFLQEAEVNFNQKKYMLSVVLSVQALESFLSLFFRVEFGYKPFAHNPEIEKLNDALNNFIEKTKKYPFKDLSNIFLSTLIGYTETPNLDQALKSIENLPNLRNTPKKSQHSKVPEKLQDAWIKLYETKVHEVRNKVAHKSAYRPSRIEAGNIINEAYYFICQIQQHLNIKSDDANYYMRKCL